MVKVDEDVERLHNRIVTIMGSDEPVPVSKVLALAKLKKALDVYIDSIK